MEVNGARNQVLPHSAFSGQQHRRPRGRHALDGREDLLHVLAAPDNIVELVAPAQLGLQHAVFVAQLADFERLLNYPHEMIERERFEQEVGGPGFHRFHGRFHAAERRHHHHGNLRVLPPDQR